MSYPFSTVVLKNVKPETTAALAACTDPTTALQASEYNHLNRCNIHLQAINLVCTQQCHALDISWHGKRAVSNYARHVCCI